MIKKLIIFIKNPVLGAVKTRLAKDLGEKKALKLYHILLNKTRVEALKVDALRFLYYSDFIEEDKWDSKDFYKRIQLGSDLGERISNSFKERFSENSSIIIIGSDCYNLNSNHIEKAFEKLENNDLVIGPANDGGYYLLGIRNMIPELFDSISWSTDKVFSQTMEVAKSKKLKTFVLEELIDLDTFEDLKKLKINYK